VFLDIAKISLASGKGGDGCVSTHREKFVARGGPDGGNGGRGGSVYFQATDEMTTLLDFRFKKKYVATDGKMGGGRKKTGPDGTSITLMVPCGTSIFRADDDTPIAELLDHGERIQVLKGGKGGKGNWEFRNPRNQTPMHATEGKPGEQLVVRFELKLIADIGLVGEPNAGKSTLLSVMTAARPKIADYPFTTLVPNLGILDLGDYTSCTMADIPGLIEGASDGKGLGHEFLRHVERTRALLLLVDPSLEKPKRALDVLRTELKKHGNRLPELPFAVAVTKQDVLDPEEFDEALQEATKWGEKHGALEVVAISSVTRTGLEPLRYLIKRLYRFDKSVTD
jgi:GTPase